MPTPTVSIHVPMFDRNAPVQNAAKTLCRNGAKGLVDRSAPLTVASGGDPRAVKPIGHALGELDPRHGTAGDVGRVEHREVRVLGAVVADEGEEVSGVLVGPGRDEQPLA